MDLTYWNYFTWLLGIVAAAAIIYTWALDYTRDVSPEYLDQQSVVDATRLPNELAIYKSPKLDYSSGLRVGLGIRYNHYKLRNGNLRDVWEILLRVLRVDPDRKVWVGHQSVSLAELNFQAQAVAQFLHERKEGEVTILASLFICSPAVLAVVIACFISQTTIHVFDENTAPPSGLRVEMTSDDLQFCSGLEITLFSAVVGPPRRSTEFSNTYDPAMDRGIALRVSSRLNVQVTATTDFTQTNLVSAAASCLKHLPESLQLSETDRMVVVQAHSTLEGILNTVVKMLAAFVSHAELVLAPGGCDPLGWSPTVLSVSVEEAVEIGERENFKVEENFKRGRTISKLGKQPGKMEAESEKLALQAQRLESQRVENREDQTLKIQSLNDKVGDHLPKATPTAQKPLKSLFSNSSFLSFLYYWHRRYALTRLHFSNAGLSSPLRLVYAHRSISQGPVIAWNTVRAALGAHVIEESGYYNVAGPILVSDVYDYRTLPAKLAQPLLLWGGVVQADEIKLASYDGVSPGTVCVRGYNIGKATTTMSHVGDKEVRPDSEGFYTLPVEARWGADGCLYVMRK